jgi:hypothetical protein
VYAEARRAFLGQIDHTVSNRDPLAEFSEVLVAQLLSGRLAASRVEKGYDLTDPEGRRVQVRYLANPAQEWINEHAVDTREVDRYALVVFEDLEPQHVLVFPRDLTAICAALGKRHGSQDRLLQMTRRNYRQILEQQERFAALGVLVLNLRGL